MEYRKIVDVEFPEFGLEAFEKSWGWLNDPEINRLTMIGEFTKESQKKWFDGLKDRKDYFIRSMVCKGNVIGVCGLKNITETDGEILGYIGEKEYWGKTVAIQCVEFLLDYARFLKLDSVYAVVLHENRSVRKVLSRFGFEEEQELDDKLVMRVPLS